MFLFVYSSYHLNLSFPHLVDAENLQIVLHTQKNPYLDKATKKILAKFSYPQKIPGIENFKPKNIL